MCRWFGVLEWKGLWYRCWLFHHIYFGYIFIPPPQQFCENDLGEKEDVSQDEEAVVWWIVAFTCIFQTLHSLSSRAVSWVLNFLGSLLSFCGQFSNCTTNFVIDCPISPPCLWFIYLFFWGGGLVYPHPIILSFESDFCPSLLIFFTPSSFTIHFWSHHQCSFTLTLYFYI